ncbi:hypothetical protein IW262DRAFT_1291162 [Armillaria fumosa]|nr:hypothetical protein IW262DRAFT_1291162 [Armillaria fumosa]
MKGSTFLGYEPLEKNTNKPESSNPLPQPTTPFPSTAGETDSQASPLPSGSMTPMSHQLYSILARSTDEPGSEEWSQGPNLPYGLPLEELDLLGLPLQLTQMEVDEKYQRRFQERYLNSIKELAWWRMPMGRLCKEADTAGEAEEFKVISGPPRPMTSRLLARAGGGKASLAPNPDAGGSTGQDKGKALEQRPLMVEDLRRFGLLKLKKEPEKTLSKRDDLWSLPKPPDQGLPPDPLTQPTGIGPQDAPFWQVCLTLICKPTLFKGAHEDLERFLMDCLMYFKTFSGYFVYDAQKIAFTASHFDGGAKDWWSQRSQEYFGQTDLNY